MTKEEFNSLQEGQHIWVLLEDKLLVVMKEDNCFYVCGAWECGVNYEDLDLVELINKPEKYKNKNCTIYKGV